MPDSKQLSSYRAWQPLGFHLKKKKKTTGDIFLFRRQRGSVEREGKGREDETKINLQSSGTSQSLYRLFYAPIPKCMGLSDCPGSG